MGFYLNGNQPIKANPGKMWTCRGICDTIQGMGQAKSKKKSDGDTEVERLRVSGQILAEGKTKDGKDKLVWYPQTLKEYEESLLAQRSSVAVPSQLTSVYNRCIATLCLATALIVTCRDGQYVEKLSGSSVRIDGRWIRRKERVVVAATR